MISSVVSYFKRKSDLDDPHSIASIEKRAREKVAAQQQEKESKQKKSATSSPTQTPAGSAYLAVTGRAKKAKKAREQEQREAALSEANKLVSSSGKTPRAHYANDNEKVIEKASHFEDGHVLKSEPLQESIAHVKTSYGNFRPTETDLSNEDGEPWIGAPNAASQRASLSPNQKAQLPPPDQGILATL